MTISIPAPAVRAHARHQDGRDIIPAPAGGCPTSLTPPVAETPASAQGVPAADAATPSALAPAGTPAPVIAAAAESRSALPSLALTPAAIERRGDRAVLGATGTTAPDTAGDRAVLASASGEAPVTAAQEADDGGLPFTGLALWLFLLGGGSLLLAGLGLRLATRSQS